LSALKNKHMFFPPNVPDNKACARLFWRHSCGEALHSLWQDGGTPKEKCTFKHILNRALSPPFALGHSHKSRKMHSGGEALHSLPRWGTPSQRSTFRTALHAALLPTVATAPNFRLLLPKIPASRMASPANVVFLSVFGTESAPEAAFATCPGVAFPAIAKLFVRRVA
jgi:hypothetical protein